jgi:S-layer family protein
MFAERLTPDTLGQSRQWPIHIGESFTDVPKTNAFYRFVEALLHHGVTSGCTAGTYCPAAGTARDQMAVFVLVAKEGAGYVAPACGATPMFADVPVSSPFCRWVEELARRNITVGCGNGNYCPAAAVSREQMAVFVLRALDPSLSPPACVPPNVFADVPQTSPFCRWVEELANRGVVAGCGGGNYCPGGVVTRDHMSVFISGTFGLTLYGL